MSEWITKWEQIDETAHYIVGPISSQPGGKLYVGGMLMISQGWQVKQLREGCHAALPCPPFNKTREQL